MKAIHLIFSTKAEETFTQLGFINRKKAREKVRGFDKHQLSASHKEATDRFIVIPERSAGDIAFISSYHTVKRNMEIDKSSKR